MDQKRKWTLAAMVSLAVWLHATAWGPWSAPFSVTSAWAKGGSGSNSGSGKGTGGNQSSSKSGGQGQSNKAGKGSGSGKGTVGNQTSSKSSGQGQSNNAGKGSGSGKGTGGNQTSSKSSGQGQSNNARKGSGSGKAKSHYAAGGYGHAGSGGKDIGGSSRIHEKRMVARTARTRRGQVAGIPNGAIEASRFRLPPKRVIQQAAVSGVALTSKLDGDDHCSWASWGQCGRALERKANAPVMAASWPVDLSILELLMLEPKASARPRSRPKDMAVLMAATELHRDAVAKETMPREDETGSTMGIAPATAGQQNDKSLPELDIRTRQAAIPVSGLTDIARRFTIYYLGYWSRTNDVNAEIVALFYSPDAWLDGKRSTIARIVKDKQRLVDLWPVRDNDPLVETMELKCDDQAQQCRVRTTYTYFAADPDMGRERYGTGIVDLTISFSTGEPRIVSELDSVSDGLRDARQPLAPH